MNHSDIIINNNNNNNNSDNNTGNIVFLSFSKLVTHAGQCGQEKQK